MMVVTQPRRVAALSTCARVRAELCLPASSTLVAHRIRYSSTTGTDTKLVFMTDGVLLRELAGDFLLSKYSVVVIDEAHERGVNTDVLIGVLSRVARLREEMWKSGKDNTKVSRQPRAFPSPCLGLETDHLFFLFSTPPQPLRLIIMSATLRVSDFAQNTTLFPRAPPVLHITARQHPVTIHFSRRTQADYLDEAYKKVCRIHARLPPGGILVFCTGQNEIVSLVKKLEKKFSPKAIKERKAKMEQMKRVAKARADGKDAKALAKEAERKEEDQEEESDDDAEFAAAECESSSSGSEMALRLTLAFFPQWVTISRWKMWILATTKILLPMSMMASPKKTIQKILNRATTKTRKPWESTWKKIPKVRPFLRFLFRPLLITFPAEPLYILPLYSLLPTEKQLKVFQDPPPNCRLVVVATNVAETSITIPNVKYVVDCGRAKEVS